MPRDEWYRRTTWTDADAADFRRRLNRARYRAQYLCIQASALQATGSPDLAHVALELANEMVARYPEPFHLGSAHLTRARCFIAIGAISDAVSAFRQSFAAQREMPNIHTNAYLPFAWTVGRLRLSDYYADALAVMEEFFTPSDLMFPNDRYAYFGALAFLAEGLGDLDGASRWAANALVGAVETASPFPRHRSEGLVCDPMPDTHLRLQQLAEKSLPPAS
jgi:hypothetical protein